MCTNNKSVITRNPATLPSFKAGFFAVALGFSYGLVAAPLETVTVVATRTEMSLDSLPEAVAVVTTAEIRDEQASSLAEVLENLAGVDTAGGPRSNAQTVVVRGIGGSRVLYTLDGSRQSFEGGHRGRFVLDPSLIKRIDMLRGPASAQYGSGAIGGVLAVHTRNASDLLDDNERAGALLKSGYESAGSQRANSLIGYAELGTLDIVAQRSERENNDYRDGGGDKIDYSADHIDSQLLKLGSDLADGHRLSGIHVRTEQDNISPSNPATSLSSSSPLLDRNNTTTSTSLAYRYLSGQEHLESLDINLYQNQTDITEDAVVEQRHDRIHFKTDGANLVARMLFGGDQLLAGLDYHNDTSDASRDGNPRPQFPDARQQMRGAFIQWQTDVGSRATVISALRHDRYQSRSNTGAANDINKSKTTARLGASLFVTDWLTLHGNYTEAYRAPNLLENYAAGIHFLGNEFRPNPDLLPEQAANRELGFVAYTDNAAADSQFRLRGNIYRNHIEDFIETRVTVEENYANFACLGLNPPPGCVFGTLSIEGSTRAVNLPAAQLTGWELESRYQRAAFFTELAYGRIRGESLADGQSLMNIPADAVKLHVGWDRFQWRVGMRVNHYRDQNRVPAQDINGAALQATPGYTLLDLYARWQPPVNWGRNLTLNVGVDNVTDRHYRSHLSNLNSPGRSVRFALSYQI